MGITYARTTDGVLQLADGSKTPASSLWDACPLLSGLHDPQVAAVYENEFWTFTTGENGLASVVADGGTATVIAAAAGYHYGALALINVGATDNDEVYVGSELANWMLHEGSDLWFEAVVKFTEANADDANIMVGLSSIYAADTLVDAGAGPAANYDGIVFFKIDGGTVWQAECSRAAAQTTHASVGTRASGVWTRLGFRVRGVSVVDYYINGLQVATSSGVTLPNAAMGLLFGVKNGDTNDEALYVDRVRVVQTRA